MTFLLNWTTYRRIIVGQRKVTMMRKSITALFLATLTSGMMTGQEAATYLDEFIANELQPSMAGRPLCRAYHDGESRHLEPASNLIVKRKRTWKSTRPGLSLEFP